MPSRKELALRPRFKFGISKNYEDILDAFDRAKMNQSDFVISLVDSHVFIKFPKENQNFWSPQLHLEIDKIEENTSMVTGLVGPNPTAWTLFMFLHFMIAGLFIAFGIWTYTNITLGNHYLVQLSFMVLMVIIWFMLYFIGRLGKASSNEEIKKLHYFMHLVIDEKNKPQMETDLELRLN